ncbi:pyridoxal phosphate-dependent aminotransferase [Desulfuromonas sp.]|uniref:pyridoxal phosphate-dependent aminotransferase n=1 Tax=Desulfuromonas sp. TaxID=892 RepID=UPI0025C6AA52|nr:pyridoxal phosphate-dependent aminotransferase [Desulfuromonas sp.]
MNEDAMSIPLSRRAREVTPFLAMEVMERAQALQAEVREIIYLCLGEPDFPTPRPIVEAAAAAMKGGETTYTHSLGRLDLRREIAAHYRRRYEVEIDPEQIVVSSGTSPLMLLLFAALLEEGDEVILPDPCYACYPDVVRFAGGRPVLLATRQEDGFQPRADDVRRALSPRTRALLVNSPSNPAGSVLAPARLKELAELPVPIVSDEIYHGLTYAGEERSILEFTENAFVLGGFSKAYAMTGWRLGYLVAPRSCVRTLQTLHQNFMISANSFVQVAGIAALRRCRPDVERMGRAYDERRRHLLQRLPELGLRAAGTPSGAFYVLADARHINPDSRALALEILETTGVALTPGIDFGPGAEGYLRLSYANSLENIDRALDRLAALFRERGWA